MLGAFGAGQDYTDDGDYSPFSWLVHRTQVTRGTAADHTGWVKRSAAHLAVHAALAAEATLGERDLPAALDTLRAFWARTISTGATT